MAKPFLSPVCDNFPIRGGGMAFQVSKHMIVLILDCGNPLVQDFKCVIIILITLDPIYNED